MITFKVPETKLRLCCPSFLLQKQLKMAKWMAFKRAKLYVFCVLYFSFQYTPSFLSLAAKWYSIGHGINRVGSLQEPCLSPSESASLSLSSYASVLIIDTIRSTFFLS